MEVEPSFYNKIWLNIYESERKSFYIQFETELPCDKTADMISIYTAE